MARTTSSGEGGGARGSGTSSTDVPLGFATPESLGSKKSRTSPSEMVAPGDSAVSSVTGSLEPGKLADLCVLDRDIFEAEPLTLGDSKMMLTMVGRKAVYGS